MSKLQRKPYSSDLTDSQWRRVRPLIPEELPGGRHRECNMREVLNAIFYRLKHGCTWEDLPHDFPPHQTVYEYYHAWSLDGSWQRIHDTLHGQVRRVYGKKKEPSAGIIDSQSVKTAQKGGLAGSMLASASRAGSAIFL
jgi:putative transposase